MSTENPPSLPPHPDVTVESQRRVWSGRFPLDQIKFRHRRFDGQMSDLRTWELWRRGPAAAMLPYDPGTDQVVLIEQFRLPALAAGVDPVLVELPAGLCEPGEDPAAAIHRELQEEMHLSAQHLHKIGAFLLTAGGADEYCHVYAGCVAAPAANADGVAGHGGEVTESEDIRSRVWSADAAIDAAFAGRFANSITTIALFWLAAKRELLRENWRTR